jgi:hypothetical protein
MFYQWINFFGSHHAEEKEKQSRLTALVSKQYYAAFRPETCLHGIVSSWFR